MKFFFLIVSILVLSNSNGFSQQIEPVDSTRIKLINAAKEIIKAAGTCALITQDEEGRSRVRLMDPFAPEADMTVWFGTNPLSRKVKQIENDPRVTLYYVDKAASGYVMIQGTAELIDDPKEKQKRWKEEWKAFYPNRPEGYLLIKVTPEWMELISYTHIIIGDPITWQAPIVRF